YLLSKLASYLIPEMNLSGYVAEYLNLKVAIRFIVFNVSPFCDHLWYMGAILYTLLIMKYCYNERTKRTLWALIPVFLSVDLLMGDYSVLVFNRVFPSYYVRNFLFVGVPYFLIGTVIRDYSEEIRRVIPKSMVLSCVIIFMLMTLVERNTMVFIGVAGNRKHNISTTLLAISLFLLFCNSFDDMEDSGIIRYISMISQRYSGWIYIIHPLIMGILARGFRMLHIYECYEQVKFIVVFLITICVLRVTDRLYYLIRSRVLR
ncbi:MAG: hypothetical protein IJC56_06780, partial [Clostridia bacterium]|nr:hypothetical protein [Clostridia bacterium]